MYNRTHWLVRLIAFNLILVTAAVAFADAPLPMPATPQPLPEGYVMVEEDIVLPAGADSTRATYEAVLWPQGKIAYVFASTISADNRSRMRAAMDELESVAGVTFTPRTSEPNYLEVIEAGGNWSQIGMTGGKQQISIFSWTTHYVIVHELAHTLGFWHEHSRPDRDQYITINWQNIPDHQEHNFAIRATADTTGSYDFESVMHYGQFSFSSNGQATLTAKAGYTQFQNVMGQRARLSRSDIAGLRVLYPQTNPTLAGDKHNNAITIPVQANFSTTLQTAGYTVSAGDPVPTCAPSTGATVWYTLTADHDRALTISASGYDTVLAVYTGAAGSWRQVACANQTTGAEQVTVSTAAGQKTYIVVGGNQSATGGLRLDISGERNLIQNGDFESGAAPWMIKTTDIRSGTQICGGAASGSSCAFALGGSAKAQINQKINPLQLAGWSFAKGQNYTFSFALAANSSAPSAVTGKVIVTFKNGKQQIVTMPVITNAAANYQTYSTSFVLKRANVKNIKVSIISAAQGGQVYVDNVQFRPASGSMAQAAIPTADMGAETSVLPLPAAPADFRGSN